MDQRHQHGVEQVFGPVAVPAVFDPPTIGRATYPDLVDNRTGVVALIAMMPFLFFAGLPINAQARAGGNETLLLYDETHASAMPSYFGPVDKPTAPYSAAVYPNTIDRILRQPTPVSVGPVRQPVPQFFAAYYPGRLDPTPQAAATQMVQPVLPIPAPDQQARSGGNATALVFRRVHPSAMPSYFGPVDKPVVTYTPVNLADYPDFARALPQTPVGWYAKPLLPPPAPYAAAFFPDRIDRQIPQPTPVAVAPVRQPEPRFFAAYYPATIDRGTLPALGGTFAPVRQPLPTFFSAVYPSTIARGTLPSLSETFAPVRQPVPIFTAAYYPARLDRIAQDFSLTVKPIFPPPTPYTLAVYPDALPLTRAQGPASVLPPYQETPAVVVTYVAAVYPDQVARLTSPVTSGAFVPLPRTPFSDAVYPARIDRQPTTHPAAWTGPTRQPVPTYFGALYPARLDPRPQAAATVTVLPVRQPVPTFTAAYYPLRLDRPTQDFSLLVKPVLPPPAPYSAAYYPSQLPHPPAQGPSVVLSPFQTPRPPAPLLSWWPCYPDRAIRLWAVAVYNPGVDYGTLEPIIPPVVAGGQSTAGLGEKKTFSDVNELGGGGW